MLLVLATLFSRAACVTVAERAGAVREPAVVRAVRVCGAAGAGHRGSAGRRAVALRASDMRAGGKRATGAAGAARAASQSATGGARRHNQRGRGGRGFVDQFNSEHDGRRREERRRLPLHRVLEHGVQRPDAHCDSALRHVCDHCGH